MEALVSPGCTAHAPDVCGSPASPGADDTRCTGNGEKDPQNLCVRRDSNQREAEQVLTAEPERKAESRKLSGRADQGFWAKTLHAAASPSSGSGKQTLFILCK